MRGHLIEAHPSLSSMCAHTQMLKLVQLYVDFSKKKNLSVDLSLVFSCWVSEVWAQGRKEHAAICEFQALRLGFLTVAISTP